MPYVKAELRVALEFLNPLPSNEGELNYAISHLCHRYIESKKGVSYANINSVIGVLDCAKMELYRVVGAPYEDTKRAENGSVSSLDATTDNMVNKQLTAQDALAALLKAVTVAGTPAPTAVAPLPDIAPPPEAAAAEQPAIPPAAPVSATSTKRRPARSVGTSPMAGEVEAPASLAVARPAVTPPKGHTPAKVDKHVMDIWERAAMGNGEDSLDDI